MVWLPAACASPGNGGKVAPEPLGPEPSQRSHMCGCLRVRSGVGWAPTFTLFGLAGMAAAAVGSLGLPAEGRAATQPQAAVSQHVSPWRKLSWETVVHVLLLCFTHSVVRQAGRRVACVCPACWAMNQAAYVNRGAHVAGLQGPQAQPDRTCCLHVPC